MRRPRRVAGRVRSCRPPGRRRRPPPSGGTRRGHEEPAGAGVVAQCRERIGRGLHQRAIERDDARPVLDALEQAVDDRRPPSVHLDVVAVVPQAQARSRRVVPGRRRTRERFPLVVGQSREGAERTVPPHRGRGDGEREGVGECAAAGGSGSWRSRGMATALRPRPAGGSRPDAVRLRTASRRRALLGQSRRTAPAARWCVRTGRRSRRAPVVTTPSHAVSGLDRREPRAPRAARASQREQPRRCQQPRADQEQLVGSGDERPWAHAAHLSTSRSSAVPGSRATPPPKRARHQRGQRAVSGGRARSSEGDRQRPDRDHRERSTARRRLAPSGGTSATIAAPIDASHSGETIEALHAKVLDPEHSAVPSTTIVGHQSRTSLVRAARDDPDQTNASSEQQHDLGHAPHPQRGDEQHSGSEREQPPALSRHWTPAPRWRARHARRSAASPVRRAQPVAVAAREGATAARRR